MGNLLRAESGKMLAKMAEPQSFVGRPSPTTASGKSWAAMATYRWPLVGVLAELQ